MSEWIAEVSDDPEFWYIREPHAGGERFIAGDLKEADAKALVLEHSTWPKLMAALDCIFVGSFKLPGEDEKRVSHSLNGLADGARAHGIGESCPVCDAFEAVGKAVPS